jgi:hypothetical protein
MRYAIRANMDKPIRQLQEHLAGLNISSQFQLRHSK